MFDWVSALGAKDWVAIYGAALSSALGFVKVFELWRDRFRMEVSHSFTSNPEEGNCVLVRNISGSPLLLTYWELYYVTGYWPLRSFEVIASPDYDHSDSKVEAHSTTTLRFTGADYFGWSAKALDGRRIFIKVFIAGRRDRLFKVYA
ncbi:hypothetical protein ABT392_13535 [Paucibacter sp. JuS9]|uniref:hypothetical protein n=1 Tax=Paucibacter sp. JuS9 TaxID=3228748 RepID=UPI0037582613